MCKHLDESLKMEAAGFARCEEPANHDVSPLPSVVGMIETGGLLPARRLGIISVLC